MLSRARRRLLIEPADPEAALVLCRAGALLGDAERAALSPEAAPARPGIWPDLPPAGRPAARHPRPPIIDAGGPRCPISARPPACRGAAPDPPAEEAL